jgi:hypothetical protein
MSVPVLRCAVVPEEEFKKLVYFWYASKGDKLKHPPQLSGKRKVMANDYLATVCIVNMTSTDVTQQPVAVQEMAERVLMNGESK